jgi:hypothetical protein
MQWAAGLADALHGEGLVQITKTVCGPIDQLAVIRYAYPKQWATTCVRFNQGALDYIKASDSIKTVVLSSSWIQYTETPESFLIGDKVEKPLVETLRKQFVETVSALRTAGKRVFVLAPPPRAGIGINLGDCLERERRAQGLIAILPGPSGCAFNYSDYQATSMRVIEFLRQVERDGIDVVWPESVTCDGGTCAARIGNTLLYRDDGHITYEGSVLLARMLHIADKLESR